MSSGGGLPQFAPGGESEPARFRAQAAILESVRLPNQHHRLVVRAPEIASAAHPGQFVHVWCHSPAEIDQPPTAAILRRPFSISRVWQDEMVELLLRVRGTGGRILAGRHAGESLDMIGPLGQGFLIRGDLQAAVIIAGGIGLAPVPFLIDTLLARGVRVVLLAGAAEDTKVPFTVDRPQPGRATLLELEATGAEVTFVSESVEGLLISEVLEARLGEFTDDGAEVFAIGPRAMLRRLAEVTGWAQGTPLESGASRRAGCLPCQVSLEERMACGLGACRSCVVPTRGEEGVVYRTVCRDGPVFPASEIAWEHLDI